MCMNTQPDETNATADRGVSPVIGVVLMVAITVVLAATIGAFVFEMAPTGDSTTPIAHVAIDATDDDNVTIAHEGGDPIDLAETTLLLDGEVAQGIALENTLHSGQTREVDPSWGPIQGELVLRHDPSGEILARRTIP